MVTITALPFYPPAAVRAYNKIPASDFSSAVVGPSQDLERPLITPPAPGIGSSGNGPDGSFNVEPPARLQGPPPGVRDSAEVLNETRISPSIPVPLPSTESYCWPGDPACRKPASARPPAPKPTPPPRPQGASVLARRAGLLVANDGGYTEKLATASLFTYLLNSNRPFSLSTVASESFLSSVFTATERAENSSEIKTASYLSADCSSAQGVANNAQRSVFIYVDGVNVGTTYVEWDESF
ncbi:MAG TPA: hypothetical protein VK893_08120, partial [Pyrinomonadaceae bacterium]|nr:hypothetical protein [Pyrinomonadaceae bacterium]